MHVTIIGSADMIGQKLAAALANGAFKNLTKLTLIDCFNSIKPPTGNAALVIESITADFGDPQIATQIAASRPDIIFHLAAVVSGATEADFELGYATNVTAIAGLFAALKQHNTAPRFIFASSLAVYGPPLPDLVPPDYPLNPASSYGTQKVIAELLIADYTRKGHIDGLSVRLPTVVVRPGKPNAAASSFLSSIIREPLAGQPAILPVPKATKVWIGSPNSAIRNLLHAGQISRNSIGNSSAINVPGLTISVENMINTLAETAGEKATKLIKYQPDGTIDAIVCSWPIGFETSKAEQLGFHKDESFQAIIKQYQHDHLSG